MFNNQSEPHIFGTPVGQDFPMALLRGIESRLEHHPPQDWAQAEIFLSTRRMQRKLFALFAQGPGRLMPKIRLITDLSSDLTFPHIPKSVHPLERRLEITQLVRQLLSNSDGLTPRSAIFELASSLANLMEEMQSEGVAPDVISNLDVSDISGHWERALSFINMVRPYFEGETAPGVEARQRACVMGLAARWQHNPPQHPIIIAGSTGSRGTTFELMKAVAGLPKGALVLPGFDFDMPKHVWDKLIDPRTGEDHPQYRFSKLLRALNTEADQVRRWIDEGPPNPARNKLISLALRPAPVTHHWRREGPVLKDLESATRDITWLVAPNQRVEAMAIALGLREAAENGKVAAVITPDRNLTRRISTALEAWNITPDDSAGISLNFTAPGRFLMHVLDLAKSQITAEVLLVLLKHPLAHSGQDRGQHLLHTRDLELYLRKEGPAYLAPNTLEKWAGKDELRNNWVSWINACVFNSWPTRTSPLKVWLSHHKETSERLSHGPEGEDGALWKRASGRDTLAAMDDLAKHAHAAGKVELIDYKAILYGVLNGSETRNQNSQHPNILIWGTLEARVQGADLVVLAGLNDGNWPEPPSPDPWLNRSLRLQAGLLLPERKIGLSAHDFQQAIGAKEVWVTRSVKSEDAETVPSRWLNRIENLLNGLSETKEASLVSKMHERGNGWLNLVSEMEAVSPPQPTPRPSIAPPVHIRPTQLSITEIKTLIRDPYAIYARHILGLRRIDSLVKKPDAPLRGTIIHQILERFVDSGPWPDVVTAKAGLVKTSSSMLIDLVPWPATRRIWQARVERFAQWFAEYEMERQTNFSSTHSEITGKISLPSLGFTLTGKADRIDIVGDGAAHIYDYKTGSAPSTKEQLYFDKQLLLEAEMLKRGAFKGLGALGVVGAEYISLGGQPKHVAAPLDESDIWSEFSKLIQAYQNQNQGYAARRAMLTSDAHSDYDHLSRFGEWSTVTRATLIPVSK